jgi:hypothetical protein
MYELYVSASGALSMKRIFSELNWALREKLTAKSEHSPQRALPSFENGMS